MTRVSKGPPGQNDKLRMSALNPTKMQEVCAVMPERLGGFLKRGLFDIGLLPAIGHKYLATDADFFLD